MKRNACRILNSITLDPHVFDNSLEMPLAALEERKGEFLPVRLECVNIDHTLILTMVTHPTSTAARRAADSTFPAEYDDLLVGRNGLKEAYREGGGYTVNPDVGTARLSFAVSKWTVQVDANFDDSAIVTAKREESPVATVMSTLDRIKARAVDTIESGDW